MTDASALLVDNGSGVASYNGRIAYLPPRQIEILNALQDVWPNGMTNNDLIAKAWGRHPPEGAAKALAVHIHRINVSFRGWGVGVSKGPGLRSIRYVIGGER